MKAKRALKGIGIYAGALVVTFLLCSIICSAAGTQFLNSGNLDSYLKSALYIAIIAWALSFNVPSGRFEFSLGSIMILAGIIGGNIAVQNGAPVWVMLILIVACGAILGAIEGALYIILKLPAMVLSLGIVLLYESFSFILYGGRGLNLVGNRSYLTLGSAPVVYYMTAVLFVIMVIINNFTGFSYRKRALAGGQKIAVNAGLNEQANAVLCYTLMGAVAAIAGLLPMSQSGSVQASLGMSTIATMFSGFFAMFIGMYLAKYGEIVTGMLVGALINAMVTTMFARLGTTVAVQNIINAFMLMGFLIFEGNFYKLARNQLVAQKRKELINKGANVS